MTLQEQLEQFSGTDQYWSLKPLSHLVLTEGAKFLNDITPLVQDVAIAISHTPKLMAESFLSINIEAHGGNCRTVVDDGNDNVLYEQSYKNSAIEDGIYTLFATGGVLMLANEY